MELELITLFISGSFIVMGVYLWQKGSHLLVNGKKADAIIFKNNFDHTDSNGGMYYPVVRFLTDKQEWITQQLSIGYFPAKPEGTKLKVLYDPGDPTSVEINSSFQLEILPRLFVALGIGGFVFSMLEYLGIISTLN